MRKIRTTTFVGLGTMQGLRKPRPSGVLIVEDAATDCPGYRG